MGYAANMGMDHCGEYGGCCYLRSAIDSGIDAVNRR